MRKELSKTENTLAWLKHYYAEFNESPHLFVGRYLAMMEKRNND